MRPQAHAMARTAIRNPFPRLTMSGVTPHDRFCDLILTGGVTRAVAYPGMVVTLASVYRFHSIGGSSSGPTSRRWPRRRVPAATRVARGFRVMLERAGARIIGHCRTSVTSRPPPSAVSITLRSIHAFGRRAILGVPRCIGNRDAPRRVRARLHVANHAGVDPHAGTPRPSRRRRRMAALHDLPATELLNAYARRERSPVDVVRAVLARIERCEPALAATWALDAEAALAMARESESRWMRGQPRALEGVPVTIKENIATRGVPLPMGSAVTALVPAHADAPPAARLREAGAVIACKTTMPDWGMLSSGLSSFHKLSRNPWDTTKTPGGSSAGAGAAAAAGYGPLHLGTDIGGSIRLPASWCGIVGLKPSHGRIPIDPPYAARVAGPMTRTVADAALMTKVLARPDVRDAMSLPSYPIEWDSINVHDDRVRGLRVGLWLDAGFGLDPAPAVRSAIEAAARRFEAAGAIVEPVAPFLDRAMIDGVDRFWRMRSWLDYARLPAEQQAKVLPYIRDWVLPAAHYSGTDVFTGYAAMGAIRDATVRASAPFEIMLSPVAACTAFPADWASPLNDPARPFEHINFTIAFSMSEQPAISINAGYDDGGLPIGLQISGRRHDDLGVLRAARLFERMRAPQRPWPM
jgi:Asp-tRNA(Asn)/Glu-tRNA(Gln) amidotransferase A subunit family amidase